MTAAGVILLVIMAVIAFYAYPLGVRQGKQYYSKQIKPAAAPAIEMVHGCGGDWGKWKPVPIDIVDEHGRALRRELYQRRGCNGCGYTEEEKVGK